MKTLLTFLGHGLLILALGPCLALAGCCADPTGVTTTKSITFCADDAITWFCANRATIENYMSAANTTIADLQAQYGSVLPPAAMAIMTAAQLVISEGEAILNAVTCPTAAQVAIVQAATAQLSKARANLNAVRYQQHKKLIP
jgi:hypothetical protein